MTKDLINIGYGNVVVADRIVAVVTPSSAPMKRLKEVAKGSGKLIDATQGRRTRAILIADSDHIILSAVQAETISQRFFTKAEKEAYGGSKEGNKARA